MNWLSEPDLRSYDVRLPRRKNQNAGDSFLWSTGGVLIGRILTKIIDTQPVHHFLKIILEERLPPPALFSKIHFFFNTSYSIVRLCSVRTGLRSVRPGLCSVHPGLCSVNPGLCSVNPRLCSVHPRPCHQEQSIRSLKEALRETCLGITVLWFT